MAPTPAPTPAPPTTTVTTTEAGPLLRCSLNCFGEAATPVPLLGGDGNGVPADTVEACREYCMGTEGCESIVFGQQMCYGKKDVRSSKCQPGNGDFVTEMLTRMPMGTCIIMGDPHVLTFDNPLGNIQDTSQLKAGDYIILQSHMLTIHGRFGYSDRFPGEASLAGLSVTGPLMNNQQLVVEYRGPDMGQAGFKATWNNKEILSSFPDEYTSADNRMKAKKDSINPDDMHQMARHTIGGDAGSGDRPSYLFEIAPDISIYVLMGDQTMNAVLTMRKLPGDVDGYCGNFNCNADDDTMAALEMRGLAAPLAVSSFTLKPPAATQAASGAPAPTINDCAPALLKSAQNACAGMEAALAQSCIYDVCASGSASQGAEDAMTADLATEVGAKFSFMGLQLPKLVDSSLSFQLQWMLVFIVLSVAVSGFAVGVSTKRRGSAGGFVRVAEEDDEEALLMPAYEHEPISGCDHGDERQPMLEA